ncbi:MAG: uncharacterized membrane protein YsdA (DUF1294 family)/cold shock CspA family protein [Gammaproteobacteria bacterium]|jgi:uncharacterized membrane protein YsdA (DUF1294 family)/cold shock CspA family protein
MPVQGQLTTWEDERGFGFIMPSCGGNRVFVHISSFASRGRRPLVEELVTFELTTDAQGRLQAHSVEFIDDNTSPPRASNLGSLLIALLLAGLFFTFVVGLENTGRVPREVLALYLIASAVTLVMYAVDKLAAHYNRWRISEKNLQLLGLAGGWPGALIARQLFRHKSKKESFTITFWVTVIVNCCALGWFFSPTAQRFLSALP